MKKLRLAIVGFSQMHIGGIAQDFSGYGDRIEWIGCADTPPRVMPLSEQGGTRRRVMADVIRDCAMPRVYERYETLLDERPDWVLVASENATHAEVVVAALARGCNVLMEKPMAASMRDAAAMARAARLYGGEVVVNWPTTWDAAIRTGARLTREGAVGTPFKFHYRNSESLGPFSYGQTLTELEKSAEWWYQADMGGGAGLDYLCYGCNLSRYYLGRRATSAFAVKENFQSPFSDAEDYAAMTLRFPGAVALLEGSWATFSSGGVASGPIVFGDAGTLVTRRSEDGVELFTRRYERTPTEIVPCDPVPKGRDSIAGELLHHIDSGEPLHETLTLETNLDAMAALDAGMRSAASGRLETIA